MSHYDKARELEELRIEQERLSRKERSLADATPLLEQLTVVVNRTKYTIHEDAHVHLKQKMLELSALFKEYCK